MALSSRSPTRDVYKAIADPTRRKLIQLLSDSEEYPFHVLTSQFRMGRTAVSKHLAILKDADLVIDRRVGRETRYRLNPAPLKQVQDWLSHYEKFWKQRIAVLDHLLQEEANMGKNISLEFELKSSIERVWVALTESKTLERWVYKNDFKPVVGHKFQFRAEPSQWWDGIINCEVLEVAEPDRLSYTWASGGENTVVVWTLRQADDGITFLHLDHTGFEADQSFSGASYGWPRMVGELGNLLLEEQ